MEVKYVNFLFKLPNAYRCQLLTLINEFLCIHSRFVFCLLDKVSPIIKKKFLAKALVHGAYKLYIREIKKW